MAGWETRRRASPPVEGTVQISPPEAKAISWPSGERAGSEKEGSEVWARRETVEQRRSARAEMRIVLGAPVRGFSLYADDMGFMGRRFCEVGPAAKGQGGFQVH